MDTTHEQDSAWLVIRASMPAKLAFASLAERFGLTYMQLITLCLIEPRQECPAMNSITATLGCDASNVTGLVEKLVVQGFLERTESPQDRRVKLIKLTRVGELLRADALHTFAKEDIFKNLSMREQQTLSRLLAKTLL